MTYRHSPLHRPARALRPGLGALTALALTAGMLAAGSADADDYGTFHLAGLAPGCQLFGAGDNSPGQLGGGSANYLQPTPVQFGAPATSSGGGSSSSSSASLAEPTPFLRGSESIAAVSPVTSTFILTTDGRVFGSGRNAIGQLGQGDTAQRNSPVEWPLPEGEVAADVVKDIWGKVVYVLTTSGKVFGAGYNPRGQLGAGAIDSGGWNANYTVYSPPGRATPTQFLLPDGEVATEVVPAPDGSAVFVITASGKVFGAGMNDLGQLGTSVPDHTATHTTYNPATQQYDLEVVTPGSEHHATPVLFELPAGKRAAEVVPGAGWTMVRTTDGEVYGAGSNTDGRLGNVEAATANQRTPVRFALPDGTSAREVYVGTAAPNFSNFEATLTSDPDGTTYVITTDGRLFGAGSNRHGQLGNPSAAATQTEPLEFRLPPGERVQEWHIGAALPYGAGWSSSSGESYFSQGGEPVSVYVLSETGNVYGAGDNSWGQLGDGSFTSTVGAAPVRFAAPAGDPVVDFVTGADESDFSFYQYGPTVYASHGIIAAARTASGKVLGAGNNKDGQLGLGTNGGDGTSTVGFAQFGHATPARFLLPDGEVASSLTASANGLSVVTATGKVYGAGDNSSGELGDGTHTTTYDPVTYEQRSPGVPTAVLFDLPGLSLPPAPIRAAGGSEPWRAHWAIRRKAWSAGSGAFPSPYTFVVACPAVMSLGEVVFDDSNDNGRKDSGEPGLAGVAVRLYRPGETVALQTTTTNADGHYLFNNLLPGEFVVEIDVPSGYRSSTDPTTAATPNNDLTLDDNGVEINGQRVRSKPITLTFRGERVLERRPDLPNGAVDADSNITVGFGINRVATTPKPAPRPVPTPTPAGMQAPNTTPAPIGSRTTLAIGKRALRASVPQGQRVSYRIAVRNTGRHGARAVVVCDRLPKGLTIVTTRSENARIRVTKGLICASWGTLPRSAGRTVTLVATVSRNAEVGRLTNTATARAANATPVSARATIAVTSATGNALPAVTG